MMNDFGIEIVSGNLLISNSFINEIQGNKEFINGL